MKRTDRFWLAAPAVLGLVMLSTLAAAAMSDEEKVQRENDRQHHAALKDKDRDIEALKAALARARADAEMCRAAAEPKKSADLGGTREPLDR